MALLLRRRGAASAVHSERHTAVSALARRGLRRPISLKRLDQHVRNPAPTLRAKLSYWSNNLARRRTQAAPLRPEPRPPVQVYLTARAIVCRLSFDPAQFGRWPTSLSLAADTMTKAEFTTVPARKAGARRYRPHTYQNALLRRISRAVHADKRRSSPRRRSTLVDLGLSLLHPGHAIRTRSPWLRWGRPDKVARKWLRPINPWR